MKKAGTLGDAWDEIVGGDLCNPPLPPLRTSDQPVARVGRLRKSDQHRRTKTSFVSCRAGAANTKNHREMRSRPTYNKRPVKKAGTLGDAWDEIMGGDLCNPPLPPLRTSDQPVVREQPTQKTTER